jgi:hypothetical protein
MTTQLQTLNEGQALIYSRSNIRRAFPEFDDTDIAGIHLANNNVVVVRTDGSEQTYAASNVRSAFLMYGLPSKNLQNDCPTSLLISDPITEDQVFGETIVTSCSKDGIIKVEKVQL